VRSGTSRRRDDIQLRLERAYGTDVSLIDVGLVAWAAANSGATGSWDRFGVTMAVKD
jgi:hypothetical protein